MRLGANRDVLRLGPFAGLSKTTYAQAKACATKIFEPRGRIEMDEAFRLLGLAYQERIDRLVYLNVDPMADPLRSDPRFGQLMAKIGFH